MREWIDEKMDSKGLIIRTYTIELFKLLSSVKSLVCFRLNKVLYSLPYFIFYRQNVNQDNKEIEYINKTRLKVRNNINLKPKGRIYENKNLSLFHIKAHTDHMGNKRAKLTKKAALLYRRMPDYDRFPISFVLEMYP